MNVKQALDWLKGARAYTGLNSNRYNPTARNTSIPHIRGHGRPGTDCAACNELDQRYRLAVDTLEAQTDALTHDVITVRDRAERLLKERTLAREGLEVARRAYQTSHEFRAVADKRWDGSYTKKIVDRLREALASPFSPPRQAVEAAAELLADYHHTMHEVYAARDAARACAESRLKVNAELMEKLGNLGGLQSTHIVSSHYEPLIRDIRAMKYGDTIGMQPAQLLLAKIHENEHILERVHRAEKGEIEAVESRDEALAANVISQNGYGYMKAELRKAEEKYDILTAGMRDRIRDLLKGLVKQSSVSVAKQFVSATTGTGIERLSDVPADKLIDLALAVRTKLDGGLANFENLPRYSINHEFETVNATPDSPRKAVHHDIYPPVFHISNVRLSYLSLRAPWSTPVNAAIHHLAVDSAKVALVRDLQNLKVNPYHATAANLATASIEKLIDAKFDSRRYQK